MTDTLDRIIYSKATDDTQLVPLAISGNLTADDADLWRSLVTLAPYPHTSRQNSQTTGIFPGPGRNFLLATAFYQGEEPESPIYEYTLLPRKVLQQAAGHLDPLIALVMQPETVLHTAPDSTTSPLDVPLLLPWRPGDRLNHFRTLLQDYAHGNIERALRLLGAALDDRRLLICGFSNEMRARIGLVQGIMAMLPAAVRADITFSTHVIRAAPAGTRVVFADDDLDTQRWIADNPGTRFPDVDITDIPYMKLLRDLWDGDESAFIDVLAEMEPLADKLLPADSLSAGLTCLTDQIRLDQRVRDDQPIAAEDLKAVFTNNLPVAADLGQRYAQRLLEHALEARDTEAALLVAMSMDNDEALDEALGKLLNQELQTQPDAVYVFARTRLNDAMEADVHWIERLQTAALVSLQVAINDADSETIINWLRLIAREPADYGLESILHDGILAAQQRAREDSELARHLVTLSIKHTPDVLDTLLDDEALLAALPNNLGLVLRDHGGDPLTLHQRGPELFLVAMARLTNAQAVSAISPDAIDHVWKLYTNGQSVNLPAHYRPEHIIEQWITTGVTWLTADLLRYLATLMLADGQDDLFMQFGVHLKQQDLLLKLLGAALQASQRDVEDIIQLLAQVANAGYLTQQEIVNIYIEILDQREWRQTALPLVEQLARMMQQHPELDIEPATIWQLMTMAAASRTEMIARVAAQQLYSDFEQLEEDEDGDLIDGLVQLTDILQWSASAQQHVLSWWRGFVRQQPITRLSHLDKAMDGKKSLASCRTIVRTTLAWRRMLGKRSLEEFADAVNTVFSVLEDIAGAFDPSPRHPTSFDEETVRTELDVRRDAISDHEWHIMAKNLREMAALIGDMGDHRSKGSLVRQNVDRQLMAGEQQPESAVDALKWMAGYLEGIQGREDADEA